MKTSRKNLIFLVCYLAYTSIYIARLNLSMASPGLISSELLNKAQVGTLGSVFSIIYAAGRLLSGSISDHQPPYRMICTGLALAGAANLGFGFFPPFVGMLLLWSLNALAQSMLWSSILCVLAAIHGEEEAKKRTSLMVTSVAFGNIAGIVVNTAIISRFGLAFAFIIPGAFTLVMGAAVLATIGRLPVGMPENAQNSQNQQNPQHTPDSQNPQNVEKLAASGRESLLSLAKRKDVRITVATALLHGTIKDNISLWMAVYFIDAFSIDLAASTGFVLFIPVAGFVGRIAYPLVYKLLGRREHLVSLAGFILCALAAIPLVLGAGSPVIAMILLGLLYAAVSLINTTLLSIFPIQFAAEGRVATISGIEDFATYLGAGIASMVYGYIGYTEMFASWLAAAIISAVLTMGLLKKRKI